MIVFKAVRFDEHLSRWRLESDGEPIFTSASRLLPVRLDDAPAMLKVATMPEERFGAKLMVWWGGDGAAEILAHEGDALLMQRAMSERSLAEMARNGADDEATYILCQVAKRVHRPRPGPLPELVTLERWFEALWPAASKYGGRFRIAADVARRLLSEEREPVVLHGDVHHGNVLDFGKRGWLVIDPKGLLGRDNLRLRQSASQSGSRSGASAWSLRASGRVDNGRCKPRSHAIP